MLPSLGSCYDTCEMACPYFYPVSSRREGNAMLPLGDFWEGACHAAPDSPRKPDDSVLHLCNMGYARGQCPHFPSGDGPDAVRFTVRASENEAVSLYYAIERDHHPFAHGALACPPATGEPANAILGRQARAYADSYRWRAGENRK